MADEIQDAGAPDETLLGGAEDGVSGGEESAADGGGEDGVTLLTGQDGGKDGGDGDGRADADGKERGHDGQEPEPYALDVADKYAADKPHIDAFAEHCRKLGMTKEQAQASLDFSVRLHEERMADFTRQRRDWRGELRADPDFGGKNFSASCVAAKRALSAFDHSGEVRRMLDETGYGDNPAVIRVFARIGRAMAEDKFVTGNPARDTVPLEERLYK